VNTIHSLLGGGGSDTYGDAWRFEHPMIWRHALDSSSADLMWGVPNSIRHYALSKHVDSYVKYFFASYSEEELKFLVMDWISQFDGRCISKIELVQLGQLLRFDFSLILDGVGKVEKPRFSVSDARVIEFGEPVDSLQYNTSISVYNESNAVGAGYFRLDLPIIDNEGNIWEQPFFSEPLVIPARESVIIGMDTDRFPLDAWFVPTVVSDNRFAISTNIVELDNGKIWTIDDGVVGYRQSDWRPKPIQGIVVDDLSVGVRVLAEGKAEVVVNIEECARLSNNPKLIPPDTWCRIDFERSFGKYRRTMLISHQGRGDYLVEYLAEISSDGLWRLEFYVPKMDVSENMRFSMPLRPPYLPSEGTVELSIISSDLSKKVELDLTNARVGWNIVDDFPISAGDVSVYVSNKASDGSVISDAIRWTKTPPNRNR
jgi:hypothetical protein